MYSLYLNIAFGAYFLAMFFYFIGLFFRGRALPLIARLSLFCGIVSLTVYIILRWQAAARPPLSNMFESLVIFAWTIGLVLAFVDLRYKIRVVSALIALMGLLALGYGSFLNQVITPLMPALKSNWLTIHVLTCFVGYAALTVGFVFSLVILFKKKDLAKLDTVAHKVIAFGFLFLTLGIISGAVWANYAWGSYWSWDPKETWSLITWVIYAIYLHTRFTKGWRAKKMAWLGVAGFLIMLFTYFGVNYLLSGLHSYSSP